jgi:NAD(P)-dependent dehydrogenase (short-subunit alcohol dehydrogenase family)
MTRTVLVTGANRGLGLETGRQLAARGWRVLAACRDEAKARGAAAAIGGGAEGRVLDVGAAASATALAAALAGDGVRLDVLVNNAAVSLKGFDARLAERTLATNLLGTLAVTGALVPRLAAGGAIVMVSSGMGALAELAEPARGRVARARSRAEIERLAADFVAAAATGQLAAGGWPRNAYVVSKALLNAATRVLAAELAPALRVNAVCPGWVRTDLGGARAPRAVDEGAASIVATVLEPHATGGFFRDGVAIPW